MKALRLAITLLVLGISTAPLAAPITEPIVFDFEDGLQGWELFGSAQRVQTQLLGGEWALFGDGFTMQGDTLARISVDLTDIGLITLQQLFLDRLGEAMQPGLYRFTEREILGQRFDPMSIDNPSLLATNVGDLSGLHEISIGWFDLDIPGFPFQAVPIVSFIDNITFHPVPEPSTLGLLGLSLVWVAVSRRRIR